MYYVKRWFYRKLFKILGKTPTDMPMVQYWKTKQSVSAFVTKDKNGATIMKMDGEKEPFPGFPRSYLLFGVLSKIKHEIKNQIFNWGWDELEKGNEITPTIKQRITKGLSEYLELARYDMVPVESMNPPARELWRVLTIMEQKEPRLKLFKELLTLIIQEDDAYRMRLQWMSEIWRTDGLEVALNELIDAEVIRDMKDKIRLLKRILLYLLNDPKIYQLYQEFIKLVNWNKLKLTKADKYHFRGKYFKVDTLYFEY